MRRRDLQELAAAIRANPEFPESVRRSVNELVNWRSQLGVTIRAVSNLNRRSIIEHLLFLTATGRANDQSKGATFERLVAISETRERVGARAVRTALRLLQISGLIVSTRSRNDGRLRVYQPTPALLAQSRHYYSIVFGVFDALAPGSNIGPRLKEDAHYLMEIFARAGEAFLAENFILHPSPAALGEVLRLDGASAILAFVVDCRWSGRQVPTPSQLAPLFQVSGSQTRVILKAAADRALIILGPRGTLLDASALAEGYLLRYSQYLAFFARYGFDLEERLKGLAP
jgi:hypothetical protein